MIARHPSTLGRLLCAAIFVLTPLTARAAATITIVNGDPAGVGFNDPTPAAPVGGNAGTTLGQQRLIAYLAAANKWGGTLTSSVPIRVLATWEALTCTPSSAVLGSAGAISVFRDFPAVPFAGTWYSVALANTIAGLDLDPGENHIRARFNVNLGSPTCLAGTGWYLGLDNNHGAAIDFVTVLTHEIAHGLGFQNFTNGLTGAFLIGFPSVWDHFLYDTNIGLPWVAMTNAERAASGISNKKLVWSGANVTNHVPTVLSLGVPQMIVNTPTAIAGGYYVGTASFGPAVGSPGLTGDLVGLTGTGTQVLGCDPFSATNAATVVGQIALIDRGVCGFAVKAKNAQNAGAIGVVIANNVPGSPAPGLGGADPTVVIPTVSVTQADGAVLKDRLRFGARRRSGVNVTLALNMAQRAGADSSNRALMYTPNPYQSGSSISHFDTSAFPNQLMEPSINGDLTHEVTSPIDLTFDLLRDTGW